MPKIYNNGALQAEMSVYGGLFELVAGVTVAQKINNLVSQLNECSQLLTIICEHNLTINVDSTQFDPDLKGIAPGYCVPRRGAIHVKSSLPDYSLFIVTAFEIINSINSDFLEIDSHVNNMTAAGYVKATELAEYRNTYKVALDAITKMVQSKKLKIPWYVPITVSRNGFKGVLVRGMSAVLPAAFRVRYLVPLTEQDWLRETRRKPWYFWGESHQSGYFKDFSRMRAYNHAVKSVGLFAAVSSNSGTVSTNIYNDFEVNFHELRQQGFFYVDKLTNKDSRIIWHFSHQYNNTNLLGKYLDMLKSLNKRQCIKLYEIICEFQLCTSGKFSIGGLELLAKLCECAATKDRVLAESTETEYVGRRLLQIYNQYHPEQPLLLRIKRAYCKSASPLSKVRHEIQGMDNLQDLMRLLTERAREGHHSASNRALEACDAILSSANEDEAMKAFLRQYRTPVSPLSSDCLPT